MIYQVSFQWIKEICKYNHIGLDGESHLDDAWIATCRNKNNHPKGCSWGECNSEVCPLLKMDRRK